MISLSIATIRCPRGLQSPKTFVIPAQAGIQTEDFDPVSLDPRFRGGDGKNDFAILVKYRKHNIFAGKHKGIVPTKAGMECGLRCFIPKIVYKQRI